MKFLYSLIFAFSVSTAHAGVTCSISNNVNVNAGYSSVMSWLEFPSIEVASKMTIAYIEQNMIVLKRESAEYGRQAANRTNVFLMCFEENGELISFNQFIGQPNCTVSNWNGNFDCEDFNMIVKDLTQ